GFDIGVEYRPTIGLRARPIRARAESHGAQAEPGHPQAATAEKGILHGLSASLRSDAGYHAQLDGEFAEVPVGAAAHDLAVAIELGGSAAGNGGLALGWNAEEVAVVLGAPDPLHVAPLVVLEVRADLHRVGQAVVLRRVPVSRN